MNRNDYLAKYFSSRPHADEKEIERFIKFYGGKEEDVLEALEKLEKERGSGR